MPTGKSRGIRKRWSEDELAYLERLCGYYPASVIAGKLNYWHQKNNRAIVRSAKSIYSKLSQLGLSAIPTEDNMTIQDWGKSLGVNKARVSNWKTYGLKNISLTNNKSMVSIEDMKDFILRKPYLFSDINPEVLEYHFGKEVTNIVVESKKLRAKNVPLKRKVKRKDTGVIYPSVSQASKALYCSRTLIYKEINKPDGLLQFI